MNGRAQVAQSFDEKYHNASITEPCGQRFNEVSQADFILAA